jgi:sulfur carrier protein ThiS
MHGNLRRFLPGGADRTVLEVAPGATVEAVLASLGAERDTWLVALNGVTTDRDRELRPDDVLDCFEPVAAG